jgi:hypothetical protein
MFFMAGTPCRPLSDALLCRTPIEHALNGKFIRHSSGPGNFHDADLEKGTPNWKSSRWLRGALCQAIQQTRLPAHVAIFADF